MLQSLAADLYRSQRRMQRVFVLLVFLVTTVIGASLYVSYSLQKQQQRLLAFHARWEARRQTVSELLALAYGAGNSFHSSVELAEVRYASKILHDRLEQLASDSRADAPPAPEFLDMLASASQLNAQFCDLAATYFEHRSQQRSELANTYYVDTDAIFSRLQWSLIGLQGEISRQEDNEREEETHHGTILRDRKLAIEISALFPLLCCGIYYFRLRRQWKESGRLADALLREADHERTRLEEQVRLRTSELEGALLERTRGEQLNRSRNEVLERVAQSQPLTEVLASIAQLVEANISSACSIYLNLDGTVCSVGEFTHWEALAELKPDEGEAVHVIFPGHAMAPLLDQAAAGWAIAYQCGNSGCGFLLITLNLPRTPSSHELSIIATAKQMCFLVAEHYGLQADLQWRALHDSLTGFWNRDAGVEALARHMEKEAAGAVISLDLDHFKAINDNYGHHVGDQALKELSERIRQELQPDDYAFRTGGDEFIVVLDHVSEMGEAETRAEQILATIRQPVAISGMVKSLTASMGVALFSSGEGDPDSVQVNADFALYHAKSLGGNRACCYRPELRKDFERRKQIAEALRQDLGAAIRMEYQPQVSSSGEIRCFEALLRYQHSTLGALRPDEVVSVAEEFGVMEILGEEILRRVCSDLREWTEAGVDYVRVAVNISATQLQAKNFVGRLAQLLEEHGIEPGWLEVELTESAAVSNLELCVHQLHALRRLGVAISIDDFGTGYSSLTYLQRLPIDVVKIDRSFTAKLMSDRGTHAIVSAVSQLAHQIGFEVVAEGVEEREQAERLRLLGCDRLQGYLFSRPLPFAHVAEWIEEHWQNGPSAQPAQNYATRACN
jgi:diguanylate cyclase (GGDEF)-like protein